MSLFIASFLAGILTIGAPCILPLLPIIVGGSLTDSKPAKRNLRPYVITGSLVISVIVFTLLLRFSTSLLGVPQSVWQFISGGIIIVLGMVFIWPQVWERIPIVTRVYQSSNKAVASGYQRKSLAGDAVMGAALGPVFNSCSPTYLFIVAAILPVSFAQGLAYLLAYSVGLGIALLVLALGGRKVLSHLNWLTNNQSRIRKVIGFLFLLVGVGIIFGWDRDIQTFILEQGWYNPLAQFEESLRN